MTTNQTIDGVRRELLQKIADGGYCHQGLMDELRALLDAKPIRCHGCVGEGVSPDHFDSAGKRKAAKPQGEPVAYRYKELQQAWENEKPWELATVALGRVYLERKELAERGVLVGKERETYIGLTIEPLYAEQPAPVAVVHPFTQKVIRKLERFQECADDGQGADIGRHWLDLLTQLGLLNRVQRSPALWEMTQQGEDALELSRKNAKSR